MLDLVISELTVLKEVVVKMTQLCHSGPCLDRVDVIGLVNIIYTFLVILKALF